GQIQGHTQVTFSGQTPVGSSSSSFPPPPPPPPTPSVTVQASPGAVSGPIAATGPAAAALTAAPPPVSTYLTGTPAYVRVSWTMPNATPRGMLYTVDRYLESNRPAASPAR